MKPLLDEREKAVLGSVVRTYVDTAVPVGSRSVAERCGLRYSSATIRGLLNRMERRGLIRQPHTSAGRVPTDRGYRFYLDEIAGPVTLTRDEQEEVLHGVDRAAPSPGHLPDSLAGLLSRLSGQMGFASAPRVDASVFRQLLGSVEEGGRVAFLLRLDSGLARSALVDVEEPLTRTDLARGLAELNALFKGLPLARVKGMLFGPSWREEIPPGAVPRLFRRAAVEIFDLAGDRPTAVSGLEGLLAQPEFRVPNEIDALAGLLRERGPIALLVDESLPENRVGVWIGEEIGREELRTFSVVATRYRVGRSFGVMGLVGPTRMSYERALAVTGFLRHVVDVRVGPGGES